jgi:hypothetical protein
VRPVVIAIAGCTTKSVRKLIFRNNLVFISCIGVAMFLKSGAANEEFGFPDDDSRYRPSSWKWYHYVGILVVLFPYISVIVLFSLVSQQKSSTSNVSFIIFLLFFRNHIQQFSLYSLLLYQYYQGTVMTSAFFTQSSSAVPSGAAVSLSSTGKIQAGGGTSIYKNIVEVTLKCPKYLAMTSVFGNAYVMTYADSTSNGLASLQVVAVTNGKPDVGKVKYSVDTTFNIYQIAALSVEDGTFVGICSDISDTSATAFIVFGQVDKDTYHVKLTKSTDPYTSEEYSVYPVITRLSDTSFAIGYYTGESTTLVTMRYGTHS